MQIIAKKENLRIDQYLSDELDLSRSKIQKIIKSDKVSVNDKIVSSNYKIAEGDIIEIDDEMNFDINIEGEDIDLDIVFEDDYLLIINKASGMVVHPAAGNYSHTLVNALIGKYNIQINDNIRPGIVHRLDKDTSGLMVVAKDDKTLALLSEMMKNKEVERKYVALVKGVIKHDTGTIDAPIGRDPNNRQKMMVTDINAKNAITHFRVLERYHNSTLIECKLDTGRTHQIRVHMAYIGFPIVNDPIYGSTKKTTSFGQMLHSKSIRFIHPITKEELYFEVEPPIEFKKILNDYSLVD